MYAKPILFAIALCALPCFSAVAENISAEIEAKIEATGLKFSKSDGGNFRFTFRENNGRTQLVVVNGSPESYKNADFVEIWSKAVSSESRPVNGGQMRALLNDRQKTIGHWCLLKPSSPGKKWILYYSIKLPVSASAAAVEAAIRTCSSIADEKESELVGTDDN